VSRENYGGQRRNMEDDSMVGTLACQAEAIWPKEVELLRRRIPSPPRRVLDVACGTGEILHRFRQEFRPWLIVGVDLFRGHLSRCKPPAVQGDAFRLPFPDESFDLILVRHLLHALPDPVGVLKEARRVLSAGGFLHLLVEDYATILFDTDDYPTAENFRQVAEPFRAKGTDLFQGRRAYRHLREAGFESIEIDPVLIDSLTGNREALAGIFQHWKEGYAATLAELIGVPEAELHRRFDHMIETTRDVERHTSWLLFALWAGKTARR
jgi:ubiquinone/menaquinone biosynthesis C-methylase UbiE